MGTMLRLPSLLPSGCIPWGPHGVCLPLLWKCQGWLGCHCDIVCGWLIVAAASSLRGEPEGRFFLILWWPGTHPGADGCSIRGSGPAGALSSTSGRNTPPCGPMGGGSPSVAEICSNWSSGSNRADPFFWHNRSPATDPFSVLLWRVGGLCLLKSLLDTPTGHSWLGWAAQVSP